MFGGVDRALCAKRLLYRAIPVSIEHVCRKEFIFQNNIYHHSEKYTLVWLTEGSIQILVDGNVENVHANTAVLLPPDTGILFLQTDADYFVIEYTYHMYSDDREKTAMSIISLHEDAELIRLLCERLRKELTDSKAASDLTERILNCVLSLLLYKKQDARAYDFVEQAKRFIEQNYNKDIRLNMIAEEVNVSTHHLAHSFREKLGISPIQYVINCRIQRAMSLLEDSNMTIAQIAEEVGVGDVSYFSVLFKKFVGQAPLQYRKQQNSKKMQQHN